MSVAAVSARVAEIDGLLAAVRAGGTAPLASSAGGAAAPVSFGNQLATASAAIAPAAPGSVPYAAEIDAAAARYGIDPALLRGLIRQESGFDPSARSSAGALGLTQLMPGTAASLGVSDPLDPAQSIDGGARYLREQLDRFGGDVAKALAAYNAGPGAVQRFGGVPPYAETQAYVQKVLAYAESYRTAGPTAAPMPQPGFAVAAPGIPATSYLPSTYPTE